MSNMCSCNRSRDYDALLERYERLERVAKRMLDFIERVEQTAYEEFSDQLIDCGVSVND